MFRRQYPWQLHKFASAEQAVPTDARVPTHPAASHAPPARVGHESSRVLEPATDEIPGYLIYGGPVAATERHRLSGQVMDWQDGAWLWQMSPVADYWRRRAGQEDWRVLLRQQLPEPDAPAAFCQRPFTGLLILAQMRERQLEGAVDSRDPFGAKLWRQASLPLFFALCGKLGDHWHASGTSSQKPRFHRPEFNRRLGRWQDFLTKASFRTVGDLACLSYPALRRRYGVWVAQIWQWLFAVDDTAMAEELPFPWQSWQQQDLPEVTRHLDYPITRWQDMAPLLAEDLGTLCGQMPVSWRAIQLDWQVTFLHLEAPTITVAFRHPHSLHSEQPEQATAVQQAQYGYDSLMRRLREREDYLDLPQDLPAVSWQLRLRDYLEVHQRAMPLWVDSHHHEQIAQMENRLKVPLHRYQLTEDFVPEDSFCPLTPTSPALPRSPCWALAAGHRPLFVSVEPEPWTEQAYHQQFLERVEAKWWQLPLEQWAAARRDYYRVWYRTRGGQPLSAWVFQDGLGRWFCHGHFD